MRTTEWTSSSPLKHLRQISLAVSDSFLPRCHKHRRAVNRHIPLPTDAGSRVQNPVEPGLFGVVLVRDGVHGAAAAAVVREEAAVGRHRAAGRRDRGQPEFTVTHGKRHNRSRADRCLRSRGDD